MQWSDAPAPTDKTGVRSFIGLAGYYRRFIRDFAHITVPLHALTSPKKPVWVDRGGKRGVLEA